MKIRNCIAALFLVSSLASCKPDAGMASRAANFSFIFEYTPCGVVPLDVLDTRSGTLTHTPLFETKAVTMPLRLTDDELEQIYQKAIAIGFFDYPSTFVIPPDQILGSLRPVSSYQLSMTNGPRTNSVTWSNDPIPKPGYSPADHLRELMELIQQIIHSHPETQNLPESKMGCA